MKVLSFGVVLTVGIVTVWAAPSFDIEQEELQLTEKIVELLQKKKPSAEHDRSMDVIAWGKHTSLQSNNKDQKMFNHQRNTQDVEGKWNTEKEENLLMRLLLEGDIKRARTPPPPPDCGNTNFYGSDGYFTNPGHVQYYPNTDCEWHIEVPAGKVVKMHFNHEYYGIDGRPSQGCLTDSVTVYNGQMAEPSESLGTFCGYNAPDNVFATSNHMTVVFESDSEYEDIGFFAHWSAVRP